MILKFPQLMIWLIAIALVILLYRVVSGRILAIYIEKEGAELRRVAINLLHVVSASSPYLLTDSQGVPLKYMFATDRLDMPDLDCCYLFEYDYDISFGQLTTKSNYEGPPFTLESVCYSKYALGREVHAELSVNFCEAPERCEVGKLNITLRKTPLSELSYWIGKACQEEVTRYIPIAGVDIRSGQFVDVSPPHVMINRPGGESRKRFTCDKPVEVEVVGVDAEYRELIDSEVCYFIRVNSTAERVTVYIPGV